jgi:hypothetical protein
MQKMKGRWKNKCFLEMDADGMGMGRGKGDEGGYGGCIWYAYMKIEE